MNLKQYNSWKPGSGPNETEATGLMEEATGLMRNAIDFILVCLSMEVFIMVS